MEQGIIGEVNLFADQDKENENYINALDAIELIKFKTGNHVPDVCRFLLLKEFCLSTPTYRKNYLGQIFKHDSKDEVLFDDWSVTNDILTKGLENFEYSGHKYVHRYEKEDYKQYYWLKSDFFNFNEIQKLNITPNDYGDFLVSKVILWGSKQKKDPFIEDMEKLDECELQVKNKIIPLLYKKPLLTLHDAACIMTGYDPQYVEQCQNDTNFKQNFSNYLEAYDYICACIDARMLGYNGMGNRLYADDFKRFLANQNTFIDSFNDELKDSELNQKDQKSDADNSPIEQLKKENDHLKAKIAKLEASQAVQEDCLLSQIFDESATERYSPDLVLSIKLWEHIYITNPKSDSHSNKADTWLKNNTGYDIAKKAGSASKIREVITPFILWSPHRDKKYKK